MRALAVVALLVAPLTPALAHHDPGVLLAVLETGDGVDSVSATFVPAEYYYRAHVRVECPMGGALAGLWFANVVPAFPPTAACDPVPSIYPFGGGIVEGSEGTLDFVREDLWPGVPYTADLVGSNARMEIRGYTGAEYGISEHGADHRTHLFRYHTWGNPAFDSFTVRVTPAAPQTDVRFLGDCSSGTLELRVEATLELVAENDCVGDVPAPDLDAGVSYLFSFVAFGFCQPECLGQFDIGLRGVPEAS